MQRSTLKKSSPSSENSGKEEEVCLGKVKTCADLPVDWNWTQSSLTLSTAFRKKLKVAWKETFGEKCPSCSRAMYFRKSGRKSKLYATIDHIVPKGLGGTDDLDNLQVLCRECNFEKSKLESIEALNRYQGFLE